MAQNRAPALERLDESLIDDFPEIGTRNAILIQTRRALAEGGIPRVRQLVDQGILPAAVLGLMGLQAGTRESERQSSGPGV